MKRRVIIMAMVCLIATVAGAAAYAYHRGWSPQLVAGIARNTISREPFSFDDTRRILAAEGHQLPLANARIVIRKSERTLEVLDGDDPVKSYRVGLGANPVGHKDREGDGRTPEGIYYLCSQTNPSRFRVFMGLSYPAPKDTEGASLSSEQFAQITAAAADRVVPPWNTPLGGAVGIHGGGAGSDWTLGCIALDTRDVEEVFLMTALGTPVEILP